MKKFWIIILLQLLVITISHGQSFQTIRGIIIEKNSGNPIPYATVVLLNSQPTIGTVTDSLGNFTLSKVPIGRHDLEVRCLALLKEILVNSSKEVILEIRLQENLTSIKEVVVKPSINKTEPLNEMAIAGGRLLSVEEASRYAGSMDDPARLVSSFAGVASSVGNNGIAIRGNAPRFLQWRMEDVEIPNPNHFAEITSFGGGGLTAMSSQVLGNSDFFTGAFPAEYGNALSGVFDIYLRNGNNARHEHTAQIGILGIDMASEGPFKKGYNGSYLFNYRYSTLSLLAPLLPEDAEGTNYQDLSFKFFFPSSHAGTFTLWGIGLIDRSGTVAETDPNKWFYAQDMENQDVKQYMGAIGLSNKIKFNSSSSLKNTLATTVNGLNMNTEKMDKTLIPIPENLIHNINWNFIFSSTLQKQYNTHHTNKTGVKVTCLQYDMLMQDTKENDYKLQTLADETGFSTLLTFYSTSIFRITNRFDLNFGVNTQWFTLNNHYTIEPRLSLRYTLSAEHSFYLAYGKHSKLEMLHYYFTKKNGKEINKNLDFTKAHHLSSGYNWNINEKQHLKIEPYIQYLYNVPILPGTTFSFINLQGNKDWFLSDRLVNSGKGFNYGVDITFEKFITKGLYYMVTGSIFDARYQTDKKEWYNSRYNRNFVLNLLAGKEWMLGKNQQNLLGISGRIVFQGGERYSPIDEKASSTQQDAIYDESKPFSKQLEPVLLGHLTMNYRINLPNIAHEFSIKVLNITGYKDYYGHRYNFITKQVEAEREANIIPNISYKIEF